jgi:hypothetical protein
MIMLRFFINKHNKLDLVFAYDIQSIHFGESPKLKLRFHGKKRIIIMSVTEKVIFALPWSAVHFSIVDLFPSLFVRNVVTCSLSCMDLLLDRQYNRYLFLLLKASFEVHKESSSRNYPSVPDLLTTV